MKSQLRPYQAIIWQPDRQSIGVRVTVCAEDLDDALQKLETEHGEGNVYDLHNEDDATAPR